ncbi:zinc-binding dehydrogenase [Kitasatospora sp. NPDC094019]|uniref:zinc-dependent alcohol dehydrogenase n=1 Tax=Kitasatospora sp. NPDC094019 TaxID=3364091 RepID=UPI0038181E95
MYALRLKAPQEFELLDDVTEPVPGPGQLTVRLTAAALCGSDLPKWFSTADPRSGRAGFPIHECVGRVADPGDTGLQAGQRVLAMPVEECGLAEIYLADRAATHPVATGHLTDAQATLIQPLATVLHATTKLGDVDGCHVAVLGLGPIGLLTAFVLSRRGAIVTGVDPVARPHDLLTAFGITRHLQDTASAWPASKHAATPVDICVEAVGHQQHTLRDAITITRHGGTILALGVPDDPDYSIPYEQFLRRNLTLRASITPPWQQVFAPAETYLHNHLDILTALLGNRAFPVIGVNRAFRAYANPAPDRLKVVIIADGRWTPQGGRR